jgi:hypothetical protein
LANRALAKRRQRKPPRDGSDMIPRPPLALPGGGPTAAA